MWICSAKCNKTGTKTIFYELKNEWDLHNVDDLYVCLGDINGRVGKYIDELGGAHGGCSVNQVNLEV